MLRRILRAIDAVLCVLGLLGGLIVLPILAVLLIAEALNGQTTHTVSPGESLPALSAGDTLVLEPGLYSLGQVEIDAADVTIRGDRAILRNSTGHGLVIRAPGVTVEGLEIRGARLSGIKLVGRPAGVTIRECFVHHNGLQGIEAGDVDRLTVEECLIAYNGTDPRYDHGVYASGREHTYRNNRVYHNASHGLHLYGTAMCSGFVVFGNVCLDNPSRGLLLQQHPDGARSYLIANRCEGGKRGIVVWGGHADRPVLLADNDAEVFAMDAEGQAASVTEVPR